MTARKKDRAPDPRQPLTLVEVLGIAAGAYPDQFLRQYYDEATGEFNAHASGDTLAEFIVREIQETFNPESSQREQLDEVDRVIRNAISNLESVLEAIAKHGAIKKSKKHKIRISYYANETPQVKLPPALRTLVEVELEDLLEQDYLVLEHNGVKVYRTYKDEYCGEVYQWSEYHLATERQTDWENDTTFDWRELPEIPEPDLPAYQKLYRDKLRQTVAYAIDQGWIREDGFKDPTRAKD